MPFFASQRAINGVFTVRRRSGGILPFLIRQVLTTGYVAAGYKDSIPWKNVNKYVYSTDTASNIGNILTEVSNYNKGAHNRNIAFAFGTGGVGAYASTSCFNMRNDTTYAKTAGMNTPYTVGDNGTVLGMDNNGNYTFSWSNGNIGAAVYQKFNLTTELHLSTPGSSFQQGGTGAGAHQGDGVGYFWADGADSAATDRKKFVFSTETESTPASSPGFHGQQKGQPAKTGFGYGGNEGNYGSGRYFRKWNYTTEVNVSSSIQKPVWFCGEENYVMSQTHGISLGNYADTAGGNSIIGQNNQIGKLDFATDAGILYTGTSLTGTHTDGTAIAGRSSASVHWRD